MIVATITSSLVTREDTRETGIYELEVDLDETMLRLHQDKEWFIKNQIAAFLASAVQDTGLPIGNEMWIVKFTPQVRRLLPSLPEEFKA